jgi:hypothetical protein
MEVIEYFIGLIIKDNRPSFFFYFLLDDLGLGKWLSTESILEEPHRDFHIEKNRELLWISKKELKNSTNIPVVKWILTNIPFFKVNLLASAKFCFKHIDGNFLIGLENSLPN